MRSFAQTLNAHGFKRAAADRQMCEIRWRADAPTFTEQAHVRPCQTEAARPALQAVEHILQATGGGKRRLQLDHPSEEGFVDRRLFHQQCDFFFKLSNLMTLTPELPFNQRGAAFHRMRYMQLLDA